jgi:large subunit ribosomal protein L19
MNTELLKSIEKEQLKKRPEVEVGDTVKLYLKIKEGSKERTQIFQGVVIAMNGNGINKSVTVRKISYGIGVEKVVPIHSNLLEKIEVTKRGTVKRSKLYFLRGRVGRRALKIENIKDVFMTDEVEEVVPEVGAEVVSEEVIE